MRVYSRFSLLIHSTYRPENIVKEINDLVFEFKSYVINGDMKLFKIPIDNPVYFKIMSFVEENKHYYHNFYQQYEKSFTEKEIDLADFYAITSGYMLCGYDDACIWDYFHRCCRDGEFATVQCKDYEMPPKNIIRKQVFEMDIYRTGVSTEVKMNWIQLSSQGLILDPYGPEKIPMSQQAFN